MSESIEVDEQGISHSSLQGHSRLEWHQVYEVAIECGGCVALGRHTAAVPGIAIVIVRGETAELCIHPGCNGFDDSVRGIASSLPAFPQEAFRKALTPSLFEFREVIWRRSSLSGEDPG